MKLSHAKSVLSSSILPYHPASTSSLISGNSFFILPCARVPFPGAHGVCVQKVLCGRFWLPCARCTRRQARRAVLHASCTTTHQIQAGA